MGRKILLIMGVLFLLTACLPHRGLFSQKPGALISGVAPSASLFTPAELEKLFSETNALLPLTAGDHPSDLMPPVDYLLALGHPVCEEANEDSRFDIRTADPLIRPIEFDIPIVINAQVELFIKFFQTNLRKHFTQWLSRSAKYIPMMRTLLKGYGLPEDLVYLSLIESGYNPYAYSRSKASGLWQFISMTGKRYGLKVNWWIDERRDPEKSTVAAAKYLKDLYEMFECWYLAAAGYNAGEYKIVNAMKRYRTEDFWELTKYKFLKPETKNYVPQLIAAALIAKEPEKYGFADIEYQDPLCFDKVKVPPITTLSLIAKASEIPLEELKELNPELLRECTPPDMDEYEVRIPCGKKEVFLRNFESLQPLTKFEFKTHIVKKGETLSTLTKTYRVDLEPLLEINHLKKNSRLTVGNPLLVPIPLEQVKVSKEGGKVTPVKASRPQTTEETIYTIRRGDTLHSIAVAMGVDVQNLSRWNNFPPEKKLIPGNKLRIKKTIDPAPSRKAAKENHPEEILYKVKQGDTLWDIAQHYDLTVADIKTWNPLVEGTLIQPEDRLTLKTGTVRTAALD
jgi:membrane-bound lytic murein transglycosylase D